ncbi:MAG TPA: hypothetical protein VEQ35_07065 [Beijerinckia sp.]|jgi:hypothetical protein|nr:hypothetical protein [Beijerinckia sp.]
MTQSDYDETRAVAHLPNLDIEIFHRRPWQGDAEILSITLRATPSFEAFGRFLETTNPMVLWMRMMGKAWSPWLGQGDAAGKRQIAKEG